MKKSTIRFLILLFLLPACQTSDGPEIDFTCADNPLVCDLAVSNNAFGWDVFKTLHQAGPEVNLFLSPFSISTAFGMLLNGTRTKTREEVMEVMYLNGWTEQDINDAFKALLEVLPALDNRIKMNLANSIWYREGFDVLDEFLQKNEAYFSSDIRSADFDDPDTRNLINGWIEDQTNGKIKDMIGQISPQTVMFLINAIYFYGEWLYEFEPDDTAPALFYPDDGTPKETDLMNLREVTLAYYSDPEIQLLDLPYGDSIFSMTLMVPKGEKTVNELIGDLDHQRLRELLGSMGPVELASVAIPKFKIEYKNTLVQTLSDLGMKQVFDPSAADLSGIDGRKDLFVSNVIHQSFIEVDEKGTEAAAATVIVIDLTAVGESFTADRSFLFLIRDNRTGSILFLGKVMQPW